MARVAARPTGSRSASTAAPRPRSRSGRDAVVLRASYGRSRGLRRRPSLPALRTRALGRRRAQDAALPAGSLHARPAATPALARCVPPTTRRPRLRRSDLSTNSYLTACSCGSRPLLMGIYGRDDLRPPPVANRSSVGSSARRCRRRCGGRPVVAHLAGDSADDLVSRFPRAAALAAIAPAGRQRRLRGATAADVAQRPRRPQARRRPAVLSVGTLEPRKNLPRLIEAFAGLTDARAARRAAGARRRARLGAAASSTPCWRATPTSCRCSASSSEERSGRPLQRRRAVRLPVDLRGLRPAAAGGDARRHGRRDLAGVEPAGGRGRRRRSTPTPTTSGRCAERSRRVSGTTSWCASSPPQGRRRAAGFSWERHVRRRCEALVAVVRRRAVAVTARQRRFVGCWAMSSPKRALITGITGQDGSYLAELLLEQGYEVHGMVRRASTEKFDRIEHLRDRITLHQGDLLDQRSLVDTLRAAAPDEIYNLAAMSFVALSWVQPTLTADFTGVGVTRDARGRARGLRRRRASTRPPAREMFGKVREVPQTEDDAVLPALAVRRGEGLRPLHHDQLPRVLRPARDQRHPLQPRVAAPRAGVRDAQDHLARGRDQARPARRAGARQPRRQARLGLREGLRQRRCG